MRVASARGSKNNTTAANGVNIMLAAIQPMNDRRLAIAITPIRIESAAHAMAMGGMAIEIANMLSPRSVASRRTVAPMRITSN